MSKDSHIKNLSYWQYSISEKAMVPHSSTLAWKIPWMEEPGRLQSMGSPRVGQDSATSLSFFTFMHWRKKWQPTPVFLPGESQGRGSLVGCRLWGRTESDTTEATQQQQQQYSIYSQVIGTSLNPFFFTIFFLKNDRARKEQRKQTKSYENKRESDKKRM